MRYLIIIFFMIFICCNNSNSKKDLFITDKDLDCILGYIMQDSINITFNFYGSEPRNYSYKELTCKLNGINFNLNNFNDITGENKVVDIVKKYLDNGIYFKAMTANFTKYYCISNTNKLSPLGKNDGRLIEHLMSNKKLSYSDLCIGYYIFKFEDVYKFKKFVKDYKKVEYTDSLNLLVVEKTIMVRPCISD